MYKYTKYTGLKPSLVINSIFFLDILPHPNSLATTIGISVDLFHKLLKCFTSL